MPDSLVPSGLQAIDARWGGLSTHGAYLLVGRADGGRSALSLQIVRGAVDADARCLLISPRAPETLVELGARVGLDLGDAHRTGRLRLLRIPDAAVLAERGSDGLDKAYQDFVSLVRTDRPDRVVIEDFTPLVQFDSFDRFETAFTALADGIRELGATLVVGLGEPANATSRQLLDVVSRHVDASIELDTASRQIRLTRHEAAPLDDEPAYSAAPPQPEPAPSETSAPQPEASTAPADAQPAPLPSGAPVGHAPSVARPQPSEQPAPQPEAAAPSARDAHASVPAPPPAGASPMPAASPPPELEVETPDRHSPPTPAPVASEAPSAPPDLVPSALEAFQPEDDDAYPVEGVTAAPPADPALHGDAEDRFGTAPDTVLVHGYLVDSGPIPPPPKPQSAPPAFASLGSTESMSAADAFRAALDHSFAVRVTGTPFLVVAIRMEASAPESVYFPTVTEGLRDALRPQDKLLVDEDRRRAVVLLPASQADAAQALFGRLQTHLQRALDDEAAGVLQAVGAVSVPDGQPFSSSRDLMAYAYED